MKRGGCGQGSVKIWAVLVTVLVGSWDDEAYTTCIVTQLASLVGPQGCCL